MLLTDVNAIVPSIWAMPLHPITELSREACGCDSTLSASYSRVVVSSRHETCLKECPLRVGQPASQPRSCRFRGSSSDNLLTDCGCDDGLFFTLSNKATLHHGRFPSIDHSFQVWSVITRPVLYSNILHYDIHKPATLSKHISHHEPHHGHSRTMQRAGLAGSD
jgi:hypothetical protein